MNNTVFDPNTVDSGPPWIKVAKHKDGRPSEDVIVRNNLMARSVSVDSGQTNIVTDHNLVVTSPSTYFVDWSKFDVHLRAGVSAIDAGSSSLAPAIDADGVARPQGAAVDIGAYEYH